MRVITSSDLSRNESISSIIRKLGFLTNIVDSGPDIIVSPFQTKLTLVLNTIRNCREIIFHSGYNSEMEDYIIKRSFVKLLWFARPSKKRCRPFPSYNKTNNSPKTTIDCNTWFNNIQQLFPVKMETNQSNLTVIFFILFI